MSAITVNATMNWFFAHGHAVDVVLAVLIAEGLWLAASGRRAVLPALLPAVPILLALRVALTGGEWPWVAGWLALSLPLHLYDLRRRFISASADRR